MTTVPVDESITLVEAVEAPDDDDSNHVVCMKDPDRSLCGLDLTDWAWSTWDEDQEHDCPLCILLVEESDPFCPRCGGDCG